MGLSRSGWKNNCNEITSQQIPTRLAYHLYAKIGYGSNHSRASQSGWLFLEDKRGTFFLFQQACGDTRIADHNDRRKK